MLSQRPTWALKETKRIFDHLTKSGFDNGQDKYLTNIDYLTSDCNHPQEVFVTAKNYLLRISQNCEEKYQPQIKFAFEQLENLRQAVKDQENSMSLKNIIDNMVKQSINDESKIKNENHKKSGISKLF